MTSKASRYQKVEILPYGFKYTKYFGTPMICKEHNREGIWISQNKKEKCKEIQQLVDKNTLILDEPEYNTYHKGYYWGVYVSMQYNGKHFRWYHSPNEDTIIKVIKDEEYDKHTWNDPKDLLTVLDEF